ncbi:hypothetical protein, conserved [Eimeria acervulina]|uniref:Chromatin modification-related protein MEAF6 n=1 Tax=Eimeria acervulina TaxID=5801 RepID=U6GKU6_EIMAC|nr:hypothetical protein, conserved [Eimeria acervulina]CDI79908.1 hypothetical protein, conserved [Eimeria acervulina]
MESVDYHHPPGAVHAPSYGQGRGLLSPSSADAGKSSVDEGGNSGFSGVYAAFGGQAAPGMAADANCWGREEAPKPLKKIPVYQDMLKLQEKLEADVLALENKIYEMEGNYLAATADVGNMIRGWEGYTSSATKARRPAAKATGGSSIDQERLFSLTSTTSRASRELNSLTCAEEAEKPVLGASGGGGGWNNSAASQVSNSRNSACSGSATKSTKRPPSRTGGGGVSNSSKGAAAGRHSSGAAAAAVGGSKASCANSAAADAAGSGSACHGRM